MRPRLSHEIKQKTIAEIKRGLVKGAQLGGRGTV